MERALELLDHLCASAQSLNASELSRRVRLPYATVHRLLGTLVAKGYVRQEVGSKAYTLGPQVVLAGARLPALLTKWLKPYLTELMEFSGETANVARLDDTTHVVYIAQVQSRQRLRMFTEVGNRVLPHATAVGKVLLARRARAEVEAILTRIGMPAMTKNTITDLSCFMAELEEVSAQGYAVDNEEGELGVRCVAVALYGVGDGPMAMSTSGPAGRLGPSVQARLVPKMHQVAAAISVSLGPPGDAERD
ncbi:IclR family transcriptional regulator [Actinopolymorpha pittospori]